MLYNTTLTNIYVLLSSAQYCMISFQSINQLDGTLISRDTLYNYI
jgi:hypothetical protein